ncbi:NAD(P)H-binding protein [Curtobacterium sp. MCPF17_052]|uniref:NAD(P)H-binding protein n=1 Tax=Curtobacterium sp. MCPF17_052 TaxID=2175655 RepID=UPI0024DFB5D4|nr:NAD(P)H-binding protein [Curtobacterium sp. MCPF17_052]WIB12587.1 NAD(P)H-binding protein [Curtobacterium sp. MCPF17_052]
MTLSLIGATGQLGGHAIDALLGRGTAPRDVLALGRNRRRLIELAERGLSVAELDLDDEVATAASLEGSDVLVLISVGGMSGGLAPRTAALRAAKAAGVGRVVYTSVLRASTTRLEIAADHRATEKAIEASGIPYTILRNGWYTENQRPEFGAARSGGAIANSIGQGRIASAPRREYGEAIAVTSTTAGHEGGCVRALR